MQRIEPARLGHVFVCSFGGSRYGISGCRRSYLSQRDLHAHIKRRHQAEASTAASDLSAEFAADLKRSEMPAYPSPIPAVPILRETLPPQPDRPFAGILDVHLVLKIMRPFTKIVCSDVDFMSHLLLKKQM